MQIGSGRHSRPEVYWRPRSSWLRSSGSTAAGVQAEPAGGHREGLGVILREVGEIDPHARVGERDIGAPLARMTWPSEAETARGERLAGAGLRLSIVGDDIQKGLEAGLDPGVGGVGIDLQDEVGFGAQLGGEHGVSEGINGATEVADAQQEEVRMLPGQRDRIENLVGGVPHGRPLSDRREAVGRDDGHAHARELLAHRLRALGRESVVAAARQQNRRFPRAHRLGQGALSHLAQGALDFRLGAHGRRPGLLGQAARLPQFPDGHFHQRRTGLVAAGKIQQGRKEAKVRKGFGQEIGPGLGDRTQIRVPARVVLGHAHDVREEDQADASLGKVQQGAVRDLRGKTKPGIRLQFAPRVHIGQHHLQAQAGKESRVKREQRVRRQRPRNADGRLRVEG